MPYYNPSDISYGIVPEVTAGTTPVANAAYLKIDFVGGTSPEYTSDMIDSPVTATNRAGGGSRKTNRRVQGGLKTHFLRDGATELLLASALSGAWATNTLKGGTTDSSFTIEKKVASTTPNLYSRFAGCQVSKFGLSVSASTNAEATFDFVGLSRATATTASALTYTAASTKLRLMGEDVSAVTIAGLSGVSFRSIELTVDQSREAADVFGSGSSVYVGCTGPRKVTCSIVFYRNDFTPESLSADAVAVSFTIGSGVEGYTVTLPAANYSIPSEEEDGSKYLVRMDFVAKYDATLGTDIQIVRN